MQGELFSGSASKKESFMQGDLFSGGAFKGSDMWEGRTCLAEVLARKSHAGEIVERRRFQG